MWIKTPINTKLIDLLLNSIKEKNITCDLVLDFELYPYAILSQRSTVDNLKANLQPYHFRPFMIKTHLGVSDNQVDPIMYQQMRDLINGKRLEVGCMVRFKMDNKIYQVKSIDQSKQKAIIFKSEGSNISMRVNLETLIPV